MSKFACTASTSSWSSRASISRTSARASASLGDLDHGVRLHRQLRRLDLDPGGLERAADGGEVGGLGGHLEHVAVRSDVVGAGVDRRDQVVLGVALAVDEDHALLLELPGDRARLAEAAAGLVEGVADLRAGAVAVVGQRVDEDRRAAGAVALVDDPLDLLVAGARPGAAVDRPLDVVLGHRVALRLLDRGGEGEVRVRVSPALTRGDRDRPRELREQLAALGVGRRLLVLDRRPLRVTRTCG